MRKLQWDSNFWGIDIIHLDKLEDLNLNKITDKHFLIQALPNINNHEFIRDLENSGFNFKESKITFQKNIIGKVNEGNLKFQDVALIDLETYQNIFYNLFGKNTRYDIFPTNKVNKFYYTWLVNSIEGVMDDKCIGYFDGNKLAGFITYRIRDSIITIGLLGVLPEFQGRGVSQLLLSYIEDVAFHNAITTIRISTQGKNINALNAYIKNGYRINSIDHWYYLTEGVE